MIYKYIQIFYKFYLKKYVFLHRFCTNKFLKEKVSRVCVHLFCRESSKINIKKMMHSGVNNGILGSPYFSAGPCRIVNLSSQPLYATWTCRILNLSPQPLYATRSCRIFNLSPQPFCRAIQSNRPFFYLNHLFYPKWSKVEDTPGPRHQGRSCSRLPQGLDNAGDGVSSAFLKGK